MLFLLFFVTGGGEVVVVWMERSVARRVWVVEVGWSRGVAIKVEEAANVHYACNNESKRGGNGRGDEAM